MPAFRRAVVGLCCFVVGALVRMVGGDALPPFQVFYPTVFLAILLGGGVAGIFCAAPALLWDWFYAIPPVGSFDVENAQALGTLYVFAGSCALLLVAARCRAAGPRYKLRYIGPNRDSLGDLVERPANDLSMARREALRITRELRLVGGSAPAGFVEIVDVNGAVVFTSSILPTSQRSTDDVRGANARS